MKTLLLLYCIVFGMLAGWYQGDAQEKEGAVEAIIEINVQGNQVNLMAIAENHGQDEQTLRYSFTVQKNISKDSGNTSSNKQGGMVRIDKLEKKILSATMISITEKDDITIVLELYDLKNRLLHKNVANL